jgi:hypothetical protein
MLTIGTIKAIQYGSGFMVSVAVIIALIWAYRAARRDGVTATRKKEDKKRANIFKRLVDKLTTGKPHGTDSIGVRKPGQWSDKL